MLSMPFMPFCLRTFDKEQNHMQCSAISSTQHTDKSDGIIVCACLQEKEAGNAAYKKRDFETAIQHYNKAIDLYDKDISFITNRAAVLFEQQNYDECIKDCELAVETGRMQFADFKMIAKCAPLLVSTVAADTVGL
jgi:tetratricopeptide (TPR) repeat protein